MFSSTSPSSGSSVIADVWYVPFEDVQISNPDGGVTVTSAVKYIPKTSIFPGTPGASHTVLDDISLKYGVTSISGGGAVTVTLHVQSACPAEFVARTTKSYVPNATPVELNVNAPVPAVHVYSLPAENPAGLLFNSYVTGVVTPAAKFVLAVNDTLPPCVTLAVPGDPTFHDGGVAAAASSSRYRVMSHCVFL
jgi:hypothetical protein